MREQEKKIAPPPPPTGFRCGEHSQASDVPCCGHAKRMTPAEHDAAFDEIVKRCVRRAKQRVEREGVDSVEALLDESAKDRLSPRKTYCRGRRCEGREVEQPVGLPCVYCFRNIH